LFTNIRPIWRRRCATCCKKQGVACRVVAWQETGDNLHSPDDSVELICFVTTRFVSSDLQRLAAAREACGAKVIVVAPAESPSTVQQAIRCGADGFIDATHNLTEEVQTVVQRIRAQEASQSGPGPLFSVLPAGDPSHANLLAVNLATAIAGEAGGCTLLDFQLRGGDLAIYLQVDAKHTLLDLLNQPQEIDQTMFDQALSHHASGVQLLAGRRYLAKCPNRPIAAARN